MSDSYIQRGPGATTFVGPDATRLYQAMVLRSALNCFVRGIRFKNMTQTKVLGAASSFTGKKYKRADLAQASKDMTTWIETMKSALPVRSPSDV